MLSSCIGSLGFQLERTALRAVDGRKTLLQYALSELLSLPVNGVN
jgi:hypothetical protein